MDRKYRARGEKAYVTFEGPGFPKHVFGVRFEQKYGDTAEAAGERIVELLELAYAAGRKSAGDDMRELLGLK
jgi:hypothetical protein